MTKRERRYLKRIRVERELSKLLIEELSNLINLSIIDSLYEEIARTPFIKVKSN